MAAKPIWARPVHIENLNQAFTQFEGVREFANKKCIFNHDRSRVFAVVSDRYQVVEHQAAIEATQAAIAKAFKVDVDPNIRTLGEGASIVATFPLVKLSKLKAKKGDLVGMELQLRNSYDGSSPFNVGLSATRLVCTNGMTFGRAIAQVNFKHYPGNLGDFGLISRHMQDMVERGRTLEGVWQRWTEEKIEHAAAVELVEKVFPTKYTKPLLREDRFPLTKWDLYNDLTAMATHQTKTFQTTIDFSDKIARLFYKAAPEGDMGEGAMEVEAAV